MVLQKHESNGSDKLITGIGIAQSFSKSIVHFHKDEIQIFGSSIFYISINTWQIFINTFKNYVNCFSQKIISISR